LFKVYEVKFQDTKIIIDGGANIGLTSIFFAEKFKNATVYSIEPSESSFEILRKNTVQYKSIVPVQSALGNKDVYLKIKNKEEDSWAISVEESEPNHPDAFKATSIPSLMKEKGIDYIDILKLDVEGAERELFFDNYDYWLSRTKYILIELHDWMRKDASRNVFKAISNYNFKATILNGMIHFTNMDLC
jgi:FkbM family methyltransferase